MAPAAFFDTGRIRAFVYALGLFSCTMKISNPCRCLTPRQALREQPLFQNQWLIRQWQLD